MRYLSSMDADVYVRIPSGKYWVNLNKNVVKNMTPKEIIKELYLKAEPNIAWETIPEIEVWYKDKFLFSIKKSGNAHRKVKT